jgi:hypothetical protein
MKDVMERVIETLSRMNKHPEDVDIVLKHEIVLALLKMDADLMKKDLERIKAGANNEILQ